MWDKDGATVSPSDPNDPFKISSEATTSGEVWTAVVTPKSGELRGPSTTAIATINTVPAVSFEFASEVGSLTTGLAITEPVITDVDSEDTHYYEVTWKLDGNEVATYTDQTTHSASLELDQVWTVEVTPYTLGLSEARMGYGAGDTVSRTVTITNQPPTVKNNLVEITSNGSGQAGDTLTCAYEGLDDPDNPAQIDYSTIEWFEGTGILLKSGQVGVDLGIQELNTLDPNNDGNQSDHLSYGDSIKCAVTPSDNIDSGPVVESASLVLSNYVPAASSVSLIASVDADADGDDDVTTLTIADEITCVYTFTDLDDPDNSNTSNDQSTFVWTFQGSQQSVSGATYAAGQVAKGKYLQCAVTPNDGVDAGTAESSPQIYISNALPVASAVKIKPNRPDSADELDCNYTFSDPDFDNEDAGQTEIRWTVNGVDQGVSYTYTGPLAENDEVICTVTPHDGEHFGLPVASNEVTIENAAPIVSNVVVTSDSAASGDNDSSTAIIGDTLTCSFDFDDPDGDVNLSQVDWLINGGPSGISGLQLATNFKRGDEVTCVVTPSDGANTSAGVPSAPILIGNAPPVVDSFSLTPDPAYTDDVLEGNPTFSDPDGDAVTLTYRWLVDGVEVSSATTNQLDGASHFDRDQVVVLSVTPSDGDQTGPSTDSSPLTISNSIPEMASNCVFVDPNPIYADDTPTCIWDPTCFSDADGDPDASNYSIRINNQPALRTFTDISAGGYHTCGVDDSNQVVCWGDNGFGQTDAPAGAYQAVSVGDDFSCAIDTTGAVVCWGDDSRGQISDADTTNHDWISAGSSHVVGVTTSGDLTCWGESQAMLQCWGVPSTGTYSKVVAGDLHSCALGTDDSLTCWGNDSNGQVGDTPTTGSFIDVAALGKTTCAIDDLGDIQCWGRNNYNLVSDKPTGSFVALDAGAFHICAIADDQSVHCWGIEDGSLEDTGQITPAASATNALSISSGPFHTCALDSTGQAHCWGADDNGQVTVPLRDIQRGETIRCDITPFDGTDSGTVVDTDIIVSNSKRPSPGSTLRLPTQR